MRNSLKKFYFYKRNGILYYVPLDPQTRKKGTAISMRTRDETIAMEKMWRRTLKMEERAIPKIDLSCIKNDIKHFIEQTISAHYAPKEYYNRHTSVEGKNSLGEYVDFSLYDYLKLFWTYETSPYIKDLKSLGKPVPNKERFNIRLQVIKKFKLDFSGIELKELSSDTINKLIVKVKENFNWKPTTLQNFIYMIKQPLRFLFKHGYLNNNFIDKILTFSAVAEKKEIFTNDEIKTIFSDRNTFVSEQMYLLNKILFFTGARVGEIIALQVSDFAINEHSCKISIHKNWCTTGNRLKSTKTGRKDEVFIPVAIGRELHEFIKKNTKRNTDFIFHPETTFDIPLRYASINNDFHKMLKKLNIARPHLTLHSYRHTYATMLRDAGYSDEQLLFLTRHDSSQCLQVYINHRTPEMDKKQLQAINDIYNMTS